MAARNHRRGQEFSVKNKDQLRTKELKWTIGDLEEVKQPKPSMTTEVYEFHITEDEPDSPVRVPKPASLLKCCDREDRNNLSLQNNDLDGRDIQIISSPQKKEDQFSHHRVKQVDRSFSKKLKTVEEQIKGMKLSRRASQRSSYAGKMSGPTECGGLVSLGQSHQKKYSQKLRGLRLIPGQATDVDYIPLETSSYPTEEDVDYIPLETSSYSTEVDDKSFSSDNTGDVRKINKQAKNKSKGHKGFHSLSRALSGLLSTTRHQAAGSSDKQHFGSH